MFGLNEESRVGWCLNRSNQNVNSFCLKPNYCQVTPITEANLLSLIFYLNNAMLII